MLEVCLPNLHLIPEQLVKTMNPDHWTISANRTGPSELLDLGLNKSLVNLISFQNDFIVCKDYYHNLLSNKVFLHWDLNPELPGINQRPCPPGHTAQQHNVWKQKLCTHILNSSLEFLF